MFSPLLQRSHGSEPLSWHSMTPCLTGFTFGTVLPVSTAAFMTCDQVLLSAACIARGAANQPNHQTILSSMLCDIRSSNACNSFQSKVRLSLPAVALRPSSGSSNLHIACQ